MQSSDIVHFVTFFPEWYDPALYFVVSDYYRSGKCLFRDFLCTLRVALLVCSRFTNRTSLSFLLSTTFWDQKRYAYFSCLSKMEPVSTPVAVEIRTAEVIDA